MRTTARDLHDNPTITPAPDSRAAKAGLGDPRKVRIVTMFDTPDSERPAWVSKAHSAGYLDEIAANSDRLDALTAIMALLPSDQARLRLLSYAHAKHIPADDPALCFYILGATTLNDTMTDSLKAVQEATNKSIEMSQHAAEQVFRVSKSVAQITQTAKTFEANLAALEGRIARISDSVTASLHTAAETQVRAIATTAISDTIDSKAHEFLERVELTGTTMLKARDTILPTIEAARVISQGKSISLGALQVSTRDLIAAATIAAALLIGLGSGLLFGANRSATVISAQAVNDFAQGATYRKIWPLLDTKTQQAIKAATIEVTTHAP